MTRKSTLFAIIFACVLSIVALVQVTDAQSPRPGTRAPSTNVGTAFTYQGQLKDNGAAANGVYDFEFRVFDALVGGIQIGSLFSVGDAMVTNGYFTVQLDFGASAFNGNARFLEIRVRPGASTGAYTPLTPLQELTATPYALYSKTGPFWGLTGNSGTNPATNFLGTTDNMTLTIRVSNTVAYRFAPGYDPNTLRGFTPNIIGGFSGNSIGPGTFGATIAGGGVNIHPNIITGTGNYGFIGGGQGHTVSGVNATVGGGYLNSSSGSASTIAGGYGNTVSSNSGTVSGGESNIASGTTDTTIGGGRGNSASNDFATIGGGIQNTASGIGSTVPGGSSANASHYGEMAYADGKFANVGDAQTSTYVLRKQTTDGAQTEIFLDGSSNRITIASGRTVTFDILIAARSTTGSSAGYQIYGVIENVSGTTALIGAITKTVLGEDVAAWDATTEADDTNDALVIKVTGAASTTIRWVTTVRTAEVAN